MGLTVLQSFINAPELKTGIWNFNNSVLLHFHESKVVPLWPAPHSGWQFFMSGPGDITNPHIDPALTRTVFWQVIGYKLWGVWPATKENLAVFEKTQPLDRTWKWAVENLSEDGRSFFIMEPGTWNELEHSAIHACVSLSPSTHASQEFFCVDDAEATLKLWKDTEEAREKSATVTKIEGDDLPQPILDWLPTVFTNQQDLDPMVQNAIDLYQYAWNMVMAGKSDQVTSISEVAFLLPLVRIWIGKHAWHQ